MVLRVGEMVEVVGSSRHAGYWNVDDIDKRACTLSRTLHGQRQEFLCDTFYIRKAPGAQLSNRDAYSFQRNIALDVFAHVLSDKIGQHLELPEYTIRWAALPNRWGRCASYAPSILINVELIDAPRDVLASVIIHELIHLVMPRHTNAFEMVLNVFDENRQRSEEWLRIENASYSH